MVMSKWMLFTFQDRYNKPDSAIPPFFEHLFYIVLTYFQESFDLIKKGRKTPFFNLNLNIS